MYQIYVDIKIAVYSNIISVNKSIKGSDDHIILSMQFQYFSICCCIFQIEYCAAIAMYQIYKKAQYEWDPAATAAAVSGIWVGKTPKIAGYCWLPAPK